MVTSGATMIDIGPVGCWEICMGKTLFEAIGYRLGQKAAQAKNAFDLMGGTEEESLRAEIRLGRDLAAALLERIPLVEENETTRYAAQIGGWLAVNVKEKKLPFSVQVTAEPNPNALALPGGPIFLSWPLLQMCQDDRDEIAFVLGHEMAHIVRRHAVDRIVKDAAVSLLLRQSSGRNAASAWLNKAGQQLLGSAYSKDEEFEADAFAAALVGVAGGDGLAGERLLERLAQGTAAQSPGIAGSYFATHPPLMERVANLRAKRQG
jgi:Zn-dependent protease with chaperone function